ncbi:MAG: carboxypeptidase-like regulatory domain-containing protein [Terracidiphilus sp.]
MNRIAFVILALMASALVWSQDPRGAISVKVIDQQGNPVPAAIVKFDPPRREGTILVYVSANCKTDTSGSCTQGKLPMDTYLVRVKKPSDGYPDMSFNFYSHQSKEIVVVLTPEHPNSSVLFTLGPKAATLKLNIVDDANDAPIENPSIILRNTSDPKDLIGMGKPADSTVLIPPDMDVQIEVRADQYLPWRLTEHPELVRGDGLRLRSEERQKMTIRMTRK